jgi:hypothetical protein
MSFFLTLRAAMREACDARLLTLWVLAATLPTLLVAWPLAALFSDALDYSAHAAELAKQLNLAAIFELYARYESSQNAVQANVAMSWLVGLALSPWLLAMAAALFAHRAPLGFGALLSAGFRNYWRWLWLHLAAFVLLVMTLSIAAAVFGALADAEQFLDAELLQTRQYFAAGIAGLIFVIAHFIMEAARAEYLIDDNLEFPPIAFARALRPKALGQRFTAYLLLWFFAGAGVFLLQLLRMRFFAGAELLSLLALLLTTLASSAVVAWARLARLFAMARFVAKQADDPN